jgi:acyl carrier protein
LRKLVTQGEVIADAVKVDVVRDKLQATAPEQRLEVLEGYLREEVAKVVRRSVGEITTAKPLGDFGLDSLMGLELRNRLEGGLRLTLPATLVWNYPTLNEMMPYLVEKMGLSSQPEPKVAAEAVPGVTNGSTNFDDIITDIQSLSDEDILKAFLGNK